MENERKRIENQAEEFKAVYLQYQGLVTKVAYDYVRDYHTAQDICQEAFLRLHYYFASMSEEKRKAWLIVVAANLAKDAVKKGGKFTETVGYPEEADGREECSFEVDDHLRRLEVQELFTSALTHLREKNAMWYEVLVLVECMHVPRKMVAREFGVAVSTVDGHLKRAKEWLRENYAEEYRDL